MTGRDFTLSGASRGEAIFARQQSLSSRQAAWEFRAAPLRSWAQDILCAAGIALTVVILWTLAAAVS